LVGVPAARLVAMTQMPQLVALFNGVGGAAAALVAALELTATVPYVAAAAGAFTVLVGSVSFSGSCITFAKLQELMTGRPVVFPGGPVLFGGAVVLGLLLAVGVVVDASDSVVSAWVLVPARSAGAGDRCAVRAAGGRCRRTHRDLAAQRLHRPHGRREWLRAGQHVALVAGTLVGASGTILTRMMAAAMGRSTASILFGAFQGGSSAGSTVVSDRPVKSAGPEDVAILLAYARKVVIVPGYGLAVAQAQHTIHELVDVLTAKGVQVLYGIHPVAGRMPGHMNVLLAEANVPYERLVEMDQANSELTSADVALVVGANDVVNPAAKTSPGSPIYGMPILSVDEAKAVVFLKRSMRPGFAGIENELLFDPRPRCSSVTPRIR
jgi:NAD(P) transhydrogenase subunit beta